MAGQGRKIPGAISSRVAMSPSRPEPPGVHVVNRISMLVGATSLVASIGYAQNAAPPPKDDDSLTYHGITLYGIVDIGLQFQTHGAPISDYYPAGSADIVQPNSTRP